MRADQLPKDVFERPSCQARHAVVHAGAAEHTG